MSHSAAVIFFFAGAFAFAAFGAEGVAAFTGSGATLETSGFFATFATPGDLHEACTDAILDTVIVNIELLVIVNNRIVIICVGTVKEFKYSHHKPSQVKRHNGAI